MAGGFLVSRGAEASSDLLSVSARFSPITQCCVRAGATRGSSWADAPSNPRSLLGDPARLRATATSSGFKDSLSSSGVLLLQNSAVGEFVKVRIAPEGDEEFSGQCDDADLADPRAAAGEAAVEPASQLALGLVSQPGPGQVDGNAADVSIAGAADPLLVAGLTALIRRGDQARERADLTAIAESSPGELAANRLGGHLADAAQAHQA